MCPVLGGWLEMGGWSVLRYGAVDCSSARRINGVRIDDTASDEPDVAACGEAVCLALGNANHVSIDGVVPRLAPIARRI
jgi:hypothetical protein